MAGVTKTLKFNYMWVQLIATKFWLCSELDWPNKPFIGLLFLAS